MKDAIASVEIFVHREAESVRRLTLVIGAPQRSNDGDTWGCRIALADAHPAETVVAADSVSALVAAVERGREWLSAFETSGDATRLFRDRAGSIPFSLSEWTIAGNRLEPPSA